MSNMWRLLFSILLFRLVMGQIKCSRSDDPADDRMYYTCKNGRVIDCDAICNGSKDCDDGADEDECYNEICNGSNFKCHYGACISRSKMCNSIPDCVDGSDEWPYYCKGSNNPGKFYCTVNQSILKDQFCDGTIHCRGGSDESKEFCRFFKQCSSTEYRCDYGGCIPLSKKCDGNRDCHDGTDEDYHVARCPTNTTTTTLPPANGCSIRNDSEFNIINENTGSNIFPGTTVAAETLITITCKNNLMLSTNTSEVKLICGEDGEWDGEMPDCFKHCDAEILKRSPTTEVSCTYRSTSISCENIRPGTNAYIRCANGYKMPPGINDYEYLMKCTSDFEWSRSKPNCVPICGETETDSDGIWHVGIVVASMNKCGGTIISPRLVITALHCLKDENDFVMPYERFQILAADGSKRNVSEIFEDRNSDVALLTLDKPFIINREVRPICTELRPRYLHNGVPGFVHGWMEAKRRIENSLFRKIPLKLADYTMRSNEFSVSPIDPVSDTNERMGRLCRDDSGGGVILKRGGVHYIIGIISNTRALLSECSIGPMVVTVFDKISQSLKDVIQQDLNKDNEHIFENLNPIIFNDYI